ncbi:hypothetical protein HPB48_014936 [Haemaphysalis longicornis]|uniref:Uncharacterized protein n=1 Tax=Haemaphysalis longicornis TaxID=44386 RepID=A0A9J6FG99_HAELO|nr:hypothetical protein HPB48_014936 [Haemaphysalis longicornis]
MAHLGCPKCTVEGDNLSHRAYFPPVISTLRTDESVRLQTDYDHHLGVSPMTTLPIDIVSTAPLDYMHLLCLGVTKKLLDLWFRGPYQKPFESTGVLLTTGRGRQSHSHGQTMGK